MLNRQGLYGDFFSFYLCDLILKLSKGGQPVYVKGRRAGHQEVHAAMKTFAERNPIVVGLLGVAVTLGVVLAALNYGKLPFVQLEPGYSAYFAGPVGCSPALRSRSPDSRRAGHRHRARRPRVRVTFSVDRTSASEIAPRRR